MRRRNVRGHLRGCQQEGAEKGERPAGSPDPDDQPGQGLQQQDVTQVEAEERGPSSEQTLALHLGA